jgi:hypothetical protein
MIDDKSHGASSAGAGRGGENAPPPQPEAAARAAYQTFLDLGSEMMLRGESERFAGLVSLPFLFRTAAGETLIETAADLVTDANEVVGWLRAQGATHYIRLVKRARFLNPLTIEGWHTTHALRNAMTLATPYNSRCVLRLEEGTWKVVEAEHELANGHFPMHVLRAAPGAFADHWSQPMDDIRRLHAEATPLYQAYLDALSDAETRRDAQAYPGFFQLPYDVHYDDSDHLVAAPERNRAFYDKLVETMAKLGADRMRRRASSAQFIAADQICGYHVTEMLRGETCVFGPVKSRMIIVLTDGSWRCRSVTNALSRNDFPGPEFVSSDTLPTAREIQERMRK